MSNVLNYTVDPRNKYYTLEDDLMVKMELKKDEKEDENMVSTAKTQGFGMLELLCKGDRDLKEMVRVMKKDLGLDRKPQLELLSRAINISMNAGVVLSKHMYKGTHVVMCKKCELPLEKLSRSKKTHKLQCVCCENIYDLNIV